MKRSGTIKKWIVEDSNYLYKHKYLTVRKDRVVLQNGEVISDFFVIENPDWINVIAITDDGFFVMEKQYRHGLGIIEYELCAGMIEDGETPLVCGKKRTKRRNGVCRWSMGTVHEVFT